MVKKIIEDVTSAKKDRENSLRPDVESDLAPDSRITIDSSLEKKEFHKEMKHVEEILPNAKNVAIENKEQLMDRSPIFEKIKQRHEERGSFSEEYAADQEGRIRKILSKIGMVFVALSCVGAVVWSTVFYSANFTIHLKHVKVFLNNQEFLSTTDTPDSIPYQVMTLSGEETVKLTPTGEQRVTKKASGSIVIYNNYNAQPQILVKNTRFETPDGKIYRIDKQVSVPGMKSKDTPGSLQVTVFADEAGPEYNIGLVDFTIPGFKGSPRYSKFFARSKTLMTGGASGIVKTISDADVEAARVSLMKSLRDKLFADAKVQKPIGTVLYPDAMFFTFTDTINDSVIAGEKDVPFTLKGNVEVVLFNQDELSRKIVKTAGEVTSDELINIDNIDSLAFTWKTPRSSVEEKGDQLDFFLSGSANAVWDVDVKAFKNKIAGTNKSDYNSIAVQFTGIEKTSKKSINPPWRFSFPKNIDKLNVETIIE